MLIYKLTILKSNKVGILIMPNSDAISLLSSTFNFPICFPSNSFR